MNFRADPRTASYSVQHFYSLTNPSYYSSSFFIDVSRGILYDAQMTQLIHRLLLVLSYMYLSITSSPPVFLILLVFLFADHFNVYFLLARWLRSIILIPYIFYAVIIK